MVRRADVVDPGPDGVRGAEVERRARDGDVVAERDLGGVGRRVLVRVDLDVLAVRGARGRGLARQVEVAVVGQVDDRVEVARVVDGLVADPEPVVVVQGEGDVNGDLGRVAGASGRAAGAAGGAA